jgi:hypothetical protein
MFSNDPITFTFIPESDKGYGMKDSMFDGSSAVIYKSKKKRFLPVAEPESNKLASVLSDVLGGGGKWKKSDVLQFGD